jgi:DNA-binding PadR family transcriptional regulator
MNSTRKLTDLELTALGIIWKRSGCTTYEVIAEFSGSASAHYRAGAGSVYPLIHRLQEAGFVRSEHTLRGQKQQRQVHSITAKGKAALRAWLTPPIPDEDIMIPADLLRTRVYFLEILPEAKRCEFLEHLATRLDQELKGAREILNQYRREENRFGVLAMEGTIHVMRARIRWVRKIHRTLLPQPVKSPDATS